jgi:hypothetical protein
MKTIQLDKAQILAVHSRNGSLYRRSAEHVTFITFIPNYIRLDIKGRKTRIGKLLSAIQAHPFLNRKQLAAVCGFSSRPNYQMQILLWSNLIEYDKQLKGYKLGKAFLE